MLGKGNEWKNEWMNEWSQFSRRTGGVLHRAVTSRGERGGGGGGVSSEWIWMCCRESSRRLTSTIFVAQVREAPDVPQPHGEPHTGHHEVHLSGPRLSLGYALPLLRRRRRHGSSGGWYGPAVEGPIGSLMRVSIGNEMTLLLLHQDHVQGAAVCVRRGRLHLSCKQSKRTSSRDSRRA